MGKAMRGWASPIRPSGPTHIYTYVINMVLYTKIVIFSKKVIFFKLVILTESTNNLKSLNLSYSL